MHVIAHTGCMNTVRKFALKEPLLLCILASVCDKKIKKIKIHSERPSLNTCILVVLLLSLH